MNVGRAVGLALLALVYAMAAGLLAGFTALWIVPVLWVSDGVVVATIVFGVITGVALAFALTLDRRGEHPFPATRLALGVLDRLPLGGPESEPRRLSRSVWELGVSPRDRTDVWRAFRSGLTVPGVNSVRIVSDISNQRAGRTTHAI